MAKNPSFPGKYLGCLHDRGNVGASLILNPEPQALNLSLRLGNLRMS